MNNLNASHHNLEVLKKLVEEIEDNRDYLKTIFKYASGWTSKNYLNNGWSVLATNRELDDGKLLVAVIKWYAEDAPIVTIDVI